MSVGRLALALSLFAALGSSVGCATYGTTASRTPSPDCANVAIGQSNDAAHGDTNSLDGPSPAAPIPVMSAIEPSPAYRPRCTEPRANVVAKMR